MAATVTPLGTTWTTTAGNKTVVATPAVGDLIVVMAASTGVATTAITDTQGGTYVQVDSNRTGFSTTGSLNAWVRTALIPAASSTTFTATQTSSTGGGLSVFSITGMTLTGSSAVRSSGGQSAVAAPSNPQVALSSIPLNTNPIIGAVADGTNGTANAGTPIGFTEAFDNGYATPATGFATCYISTGYDSSGTANVTWFATTPSTYASIAVELTAGSATPIGKLISDVQNSPGMNASQAITRASFF